MAVVSALKPLAKGVADAVAELVKRGYPENTARKIATGELPMDDASRMARAADQDYELDTTVYHSTDTDFAEFDPERAIGSQFWSTTDRAAVEAGEVGAAGRGVIKEMRHRIKNPAGWEEYDKFGIDELIAQGYDGLKLPESDGTATFVAFEPSQYRDVNAAFDPDNVGKNNLLGSASPDMLAATAGATGAGVAGMNAMDPDTEAEIDRRITARVRGGQYAQRRQQREQRYGALRQSLLSGIEEVTSNIANAFRPEEVFNSLEMPQRGLLGLGMGSAQMARGESPQSALAEAARIAGQPVDETAYEAGAYAQDQGATPLQSALVNVGVQMMSPL